MTSGTEASRGITPAQHGVWVAQKMRSASKAYRIGEFIEIQGRIMPEVFDAAVRRVVQDHETLRVVVTEGEHGLRQTVATLLENPLTFVDVSSNADPQTAAEAWMEADFDTPPPPGSARLYSFALICTGSDRFIFYQAYDHLAADGVSGWLVARQIARNYTALIASQPIPGPAAGEPGALPGMLDLMLQEAERYANSGRREVDRAFWHAYLRDWSGPLRLVGPAIFPADRYSTRSITVPDCLHAKTRSVAASAGVSFAQVMIAVVALWLTEMTGIDDLVLAVPVSSLSGRTRNIPGMMSNVLPLRLALGAGATLIGMARDVSRQQRTLLRHHPYRGERLAREVLGSDDPAGAPASFGPTVNVMAFDYALSFAGNPCVARNISVGPVDDISVLVYDRSDGNGCMIDLNAHPQLYDVPRLEEHRDRLSHMLEAAISCPLAPVGRLNLPQPAGSVLVPAEWQSTARPVETLAFAEIFERQAFLAPDAPAIITAEDVVSYKTPVISLNAGSVPTTSWQPFFRSRQC